MTSPFNTYNKKLNINKTCERLIFIFVNECNSEATYWNHAWYTSAIKRMFSLWQVFSLGDEMTRIPWEGTSVSFDTFNISILPVSSWWTSRTCHVMDCLSKAIRRIEMLVATNKWAGIQHIYRNTSEEIPWPYGKHDATQHYYVVIVPRFLNHALEGCIIAILI